jgi:integrase
LPSHTMPTARRERTLVETKTETSDAWLPIPDIVTAGLKIRRGQQERERVAAGEIWQQTKDVPSLIFTGRYGTPIDPRTLNRKFVARCEAAGVRPITVHDARHTCATLLVDLDVHPRVIMRILRHADQAVTMEIYANASSAATREALRRLGETLH